MGKVVFKLELNPKAIFWLFQGEIGLKVFNMTLFVDNCGMLALQKTSFNNKSDILALQTTSYVSNDDMLVLQIRVKKCFKMRFLL